MRVASRKSSLMNASQQLNQPELNLESPPSRRQDFSSEAFIASRLAESPTGQVRLLESILERENRWRAIKRVLKNNGAPGVDGMTCRKLPAYLIRRWEKIRATILDGTYKPLPVRRWENLGTAFFRVYVAVVLRPGRTNNK